MTDFNTWNESLIRKIRKSSLFENEGGVDQESEMCPRCEEIVYRLRCLKGEYTTTEKEREGIQRDIDFMLAQRFEDVCFRSSFGWRDTCWGYDYWLKAEDFLSRHTSSDCDRF